MSPTWGPKWSLSRPKIIKKLTPKSIILLILLRSDFGGFYSILRAKIGAKMVPKMYQNTTTFGQEAARRPPKSAPAPAFEHRKRRIGPPFWSNHFGPPFWSRRLNIWTPILEQHESNLGSKMEPESARNHKKIDAKIDRKINASKNWFFRDFDGFWEEKWSQIGTKIDQKIDVYFETSIFKRTYKNQYFFILFLIFWGRFSKPKWPKKRS